MITDFFFWGVLDLCVEKTGEYHEGTQQKKNVKPPCELLTSELGVGGPYDDLR